MKKCGLCFAALAALVLLPGNVLCQSIPVTGSVPVIEADSAPSTTNVSGAVRTTLDAPVPGATVHIVHLPTGHSWVGWTDDDGNFSFRGLPVGRYRLEVRQLGFSKSQTEMDFAGGANVPAKFTLHVGTSPSVEEITKSSADAKPPLAGAPPPDKSTESTAENKTAAESTPPAANAKGAEAAHDAVVATNPANATKSAKNSKKNKKVETLDASAAVPGGSDISSTLGDASSSDAVSISGTVNRAATLGGTGSFSSAVVFAATSNSNGAPTSSVGNFPLPGQSGGETAASPKASKVGGSKKSKKSKQAQSTGDATEFGQGIEDLWTQKTVSNLSANQVHLSLTNRYDNGVWDAHPYSLVGIPSVPFPSFGDVFSLRLGGPLVIPHVYNGRQRTFFFLSTQLNRAMQLWDTFSSVPTLAERNGDFSARGVLLYDPASSMTGPRTLLGTSIPQNRIDKNAEAMLAYFPLPNLPGFVDNFHLQAQLPLDNNLVSFRVLHEISSRFSASAHYSAAITNQDNLRNFPQLTNTSTGLAQGVTLSLNQNWSPRLSNSTKVYWTRNSLDNINGFAFNNNLANQLGIQGVSQAPVDWGLPFSHFTNYNELHDLAPSLQKNQTLRVTDNLTYVLPKHTIQLGGEVRWIDINADANPAPRGEFEFTGIMTSQLDANGIPVDGTGYDLADFLLGLPQTANLGYALGGTYTYLRSNAYNVYAQDDWRIRPSFSINFGVRYEIQTAPIEKFNRMADLVINNSITAVENVLPGQVNPFTGQTMPRSLVNTSPNNWGPRLGIAWRPNIKFPLVLRTGYGIFYNESIYNQLANSMALQPPFANAQTWETSTAKVLTIENSFTTPGSGFFTNTVAVDPNYHVGSAQLWNVSLESQVKPNLLIEVNYNGTKGTHLDMLHAPNRAPNGSPFTTELDRRIPNAPGFIYDTSGASSIYQGVQLIVRRQASHGLIIQGNYSYSKSLDNASSIILGVPMVVQDENNLAAEWGHSDFDVRHQFGNTLSYDVPFGPSRRWLHDGWICQILRDFKLSEVTTITSGTPFTARVLGNVADNTGTGVELSQRADQVGNPWLPASQRTPLRYFNTAAFVVPASGLFGDAPRNTIPGPGVSNVDFSIARKFKFGEGARRELELRWEIRNVFNTPAFQGLDNVVNSDTYGSVQRVAPMRSMDFYIKVNF